MNKIKNLWHALTTPQSTNYNDTRREFMTNVIFIMLTVVGAIFVVVFSIALIMDPANLSSWFVTIGMQLFLIGGWWLSHKGYWRFTSYVPSILFFLLALKVNTETGLGTIAMLQYTIAILLAIILVGGIFQWVAVAFGIGAYLVIGWMHVQGQFPPPPVPEENYATFVIPVGGMLIFITLVQWFYAQQFRHIMAEANTYANELAEHQAVLEKTVEDRTSELNRLLNSISDAVIATAPNGTILSWNPAAEQLSGWSAEEAIGQPFTMLFNEDVIPVLQKEIDEAVASATAQQIETSWICKDGTQRLTRLAVSAIFDDRQALTGIVGVAADITEQKQMEEERERLQQEVIDAQKQMIQDLSTPVIPVMQGIIVMPLVGSIDSMRARDITRTLLSGITRHSARIVIIDVTGVSIMDTGIVNHLNKTIQAAQLKGAKTIITGISDAVAESIVDLGIDWSGITTLSNLQMGLVRALSSLGVKLERNSNEQ